ncbi:hypothetical protein OIU84_023159 [Salix udensis]|uniref:Uncharacterized protein n=1 Tax=Salix udensis TaxID=889485 RepID=A0AAD6PG07_9ROSI|nr:hypothetical protein OIU84_023159 [Salix udensis]
MVGLALADLLLVDPQWVGVPRWVGGGERNGAEERRAKALVGQLTDDDGEGSVVRRGEEKLCGGGYWNVTGGWYGGEGEGNV